MFHALRLASYAEGFTAPNPMVGAVLVWNDTIIGKGFHEKCGGPHAEVNCIHSVPPHLTKYIPQSTLYVTLEPCNHFGKTPPCVNIILEYKIPKVVIACVDSFSKVNGTGIERLKAAGVEVLTGLLQNEARYINRKFFYFHERQLPFVTLKWANTIDGKMGSGNDKRVLISNSFTQRWIHRLRSQHQGILIGVNTANFDNPTLDTRYNSAINPPIKIILDEEGIIHPNLTIFKQGQNTIVFTKNNQLAEKLSIYAPVTIIQIPTNEGLLWILKELFRRNIQSILVEGGANILQQFIHADLWQEAIQIIGYTKDAHNTLDAPKMDAQYLRKKTMLSSDTILFYNNFQ